MKAPAVPASPFAVVGVILSMTLVALGNGLVFTYVPVRLAAEGFPPWVAGALAGCLVAGGVIARVGHARAFAIFAALVNLSTLAIALPVDAWLWTAARGLYGFAISGLFIVSQSWLNDAADNAWRGKVIAAFYTSYVIGIGGGAFMLRIVALDSNHGPLLALAFGTLAILPVGLTRLRAPPPPEVTRVDFPAMWRVSPVGLVGLFAVGGLTMLVQGFAPIYASAEGYSKDDVALLVFLMQFGMLAVQFPLGALSDRIDRRLVLVLACAILVASASLASVLDTPPLAVLVLVFAVWAGATESIYSVANAHANDRADPSRYVSVSSTLLVAWSVSGVVLPGLATALSPVVGPHAFMLVAIGVAIAYGVFVVYRIRRREPVPEADTEPYQQVSAQAPYPPELSPLAPEAEE